MKRKFLLMAIGVCLANFLFGQTYTGQFYAPNTNGMYTDPWFNLKPQSGVNSSNNWNIYHQDNSSLFQVWLASTQPSIQVGAGRITNFYVNGNVGIGITSPSAKLHINGNGGGNIDLLVNGRITTGDASNAGGMWVNSAQNMFVGANGATTLGFYNNGAWRMIVDNTGNVGIGTTNPGSYKLAVEGKIGAREINVIATNPWPDYVFEKNYKLPSLEEIKNYIDQNQHLPEVPSAKEVEKNGVNLGEMNAVLLKKIEELTLYMIELKKENIIQQGEIQKLKDIVTKK